MSEAWFLTLERQLHRYCQRKVRLRIAGGRSVYLRLNKNSPFPQPWQHLKINFEIIYLGIYNRMYLACWRLKAVLKYNSQCISCLADISYVHCDEFVCRPGPPSDGIFRPSTPIQIVKIMIRILSENYQNIIRNYQKIIRNYENIITQNYQNIAFLNLVVNTGYVRKLNFFECWRPNLAVNIYFPAVKMVVNKLLTAICGAVRFSVLRKDHLKMDKQPEFCIESPLGLVDGIAICDKKIKEIGRASCRERV